MTDDVQKELADELWKWTIDRVKKDKVVLKNPAEYDKWDGPPKKLLSNKEFIINAVKLDEGCLSYADVSLAYDPDLTLNKINKL